MIRILNEIEALSPLLNKFKNAYMGCFFEKEQKYRLLFFIGVQYLYKSSKIVLLSTRIDSPRESA